MAGTSVLKLKVDDKEYNSSLKKAQEGLQHLEQSLKDAGKSFTQVDKSVVDYVRGIGQMEAQSKTARGRISEMSNAFVELSLQYKNMSNEVKSSDVGKALAESMEQLKQRTIEAKNELDSLNGELNNVKIPDIKGNGLFSGMGDKMSGAIQVFAGNMMTKAAGAVAELGSEIFASVQQGIELARQGEGIRIAFERLGRGDILQGLRDATHGTVTDLELMKAAVKFNDFKLPLDELGTMLQFAQQKAKDTGQSVDYMTESIVTGLGRKSLMILDNLGLSAAEIKEKMAETGDMTKAVGAIIREQMSKAGDYVETAADRAAQANVSLQNKMEELGRKFAPVEEASSQLWTSMKIGILDIIGGPLATLLNQLTEAGRLKNQLNNMNGEPGSGNTKVDQQLKKLNVIKKGGGSDYIFNSTLNGMMEDYNRQIAALDAKIKDTKKLSPDQQASKFVRDEVQKMSEQMKVLGMMRDQLAAGAKELSKPVDVKIETKGAEQNVESLKVKLIELEAQRKKAIAAGDTDLSKNLAKQISQVKSDIKGLGGTTTTTTTHKATPQEKADETYKKAQQDYQQALAQAALEVKAGTINSADAKKKELQAAESLWKSIGDARETYDSPKLKDAQAKVEQDIIRLGGEVTKAVEAQKRSEQAARELETAQKKLADAQSRLAEAQKSGNLKEIYAAEKNVTTAQKDVTRLETIKVNVEKGTIDLPDIPKEQEVKIIANTDNISAQIAHLKEQLGGLEIGSLDFNQTQANLVDMTTLQSIVNEQMKAGLKIDPDVVNDMFSKITKGFDIEDGDWQGIVDKINKKLAEMNIKPIKINFETGEIATDGKEAAKDWRNVSTAISAVGSAMSSIEDPTAKVVGIIAQAIATIALTYAKSLEGTFTIWDWIAGAASGAATLVSVISTIHSSTGYANGGIVKGNSYSGDNIGAMVDGSQMVGLNAGELVLTHAQQNVLANELQGGGMQNMRLQTEVRGRSLIFVLDNELKAQGKGQLATFK